MNFSEFHAIKENIFAAFPLNFFFSHKVEINISFIAYLKSVLNEVRFLNSISAIDQHNSYSTNSTTVINANPNNHIYSTHIRNLMRQDLFSAT